MDDIFYLCSAKVGLKDIKDIAEELKAKKIIVVEAKDTMEVIYHDNTRAYWTNMELEEFCEPDYTAFFIENEICTVFCISFHPINFNSTKSHLVKILEKYDGWVGMDSDGFYPYFDVDNIDGLVVEL